MWHKPNKKKDQEPMEGCLRSYSPVVLSEFFQGPEVPMVPMVIIFPASSGYVYFKKKTLTHEQITNDVQRFDFTRGESICGDTWY